MTKEHALAELIRNEYPADSLASLRILPDGRAAWVRRFIFTCAIVVANEQALPYGSSDRWCYHTWADAERALEEWNGVGDPEGWHRHPGDGRRRTNGDPAKEYVAP